MANGTTREALARADRIRERAKQSQKATRNALDNLRKATVAPTPGSEPYREEMDSVSEVTIGKEGVRVKSRAPWLQFAISVLVFLAFVVWMFKR